MGQVCMLNDSTKPVKITSGSDHLCCQSANGYVTVYHNDLTNDCALSEIVVHLGTN